MTGNDAPKNILHRSSLKFNSQMKTNTIILEGGLGNRMRVAAAAYTLALKIQQPLRVLWLPQWGMPCRFDQLFLPLQTPLPFQLRDAQGLEKIIYTRARLSNLWMPRLAQKLLYRHIILAPQIYYLNKDGFDYEAWFRQGNAFMTAYRDFCSWDDALLAQLFQPLPALQQQIDQQTARFTASTIGVHIRRTDNQQSILQSPIQLFFDTLDRLLQEQPDTLIYLATDDQATKQQMRQRYGTQRIITSTQPATRDNDKGIQDALVEMYTLSRTSKIYGSAESTFSEMAAKLGQIPLYVLRCDSNRSKC